MRPIDVCSCDEIEIVSEDVEGDMRDDFTNFAWGESSVSHTIEIVVIDTASLFNNDLGEIDRCSIFAVLDLSFRCS